MFPNSQKTELTNEQLSGKSTKDGDDFFTKHGSKIAIVGFSITAYLVYSFFKGGQLRTEEEEKVIVASMVEPNEINELRLMNNQLDPILFEKMIIDSFHHFQILQRQKQSNLGTEDNDINISYDSFIQYATHYLHSQIKHGHILDRIVLSLPDAILSSQPKNSNESYYSDSGSSSSNDSHKVPTLLLSDVSLPLHLQLVLLSAALPAPALERAHQLFTIAACLQALQLAKQREQAVAGAVEIEEIPWSIAEILLQDLITTSQLPTEKEVCETGIKYPWRTYRRKTPTDMVNSFKTARKIDGQVMHFVLSTRLIFSSHLKVLFVL